MGQRRLTSHSPQRANIARIVSPTNQNLIYDPNTRSFLPEAQILAYEQRIQDVAQQPVKKKKKAPLAAGTHLAEGTAGGRPQGTFIDALEAAKQQPVTQPVTQPAPTPAPVPAPASVQPAAVAPPKKKKKKVVLSEPESDQASYMPDSSDNDSDFVARQKQQGYNTRAGALLAKKPSVVREDRQREEEQDDTPKRATAGLAPLNTSPDAGRPISPSPLPRSQAGRGHGRGQASASAAYAQDRQQARSASQPAPAPASPITNGVGLTTKDSVRGGRVASVSPMRTHFAATPESLGVKHYPPARSVSPRKSAMKHSNSPRGPSPAPGTSATESNPSEASNGSVVGESGLTPRRKANRVSFDDTNVAVGQAAPIVSSDSPTVLSPQTKRQWFSIGRGKKKDNAVMDEDDSETMQPRPALPSFGSVREKKNPREVEERALVRPAEHTETKPAAPSPLFTTPNGDAIEHYVASSNDHGAGAIIAQDAASRNTANISKSREPLPPMVTSVEGNGENSDSEGSLYSLEHPKLDGGVTRTQSVKRGPEDGNAETYQALASPLSQELHPEEATNANPNVPQISVLQATPTLEKTESSREWPNMPGSWANTTPDYSDSQHQGQASEEGSHAVVEHHATEPSLADVGIAEPEPETPRAGSPVLGEIAAYNAHPMILEEPEESDASVYSDAAEDFSDVEGGFMSLNAVVESPLPKSKMPGLAISTPPDSPTTKSTKERAFKKSQLSRKSSEPEMGQGWEKVQAYWSTLSADKKRQLEQEAREEAEEGSETETEIKPAPKPKKKKKVVAKPAPVVIPETTQQQNERSYMIQPGAKAGANGHAPLKSSMRAEPANTAQDTHIRKSMRGPDSMRGSLRAEESKGSLQKKNRPMSLPAQVKADPAEVQKHVRNLSSASAAAASSAAKRDMAPPVPALRRRGSGDSDSSFKRARVGNNNNVPSMRSSMRGHSVRGSVDSSAAARPLSPTQSSRFSIRSLSPTGSTFRRPFNSGAAPQASLSETHMRNSMRSSYDSAPTMRASKPQKPAKGGFGRSAPPKQVKPARKASRFADSSDEEDERPSFRSRFVDSSDEDEPAPLPAATSMPKSMRKNAPVRGIPKTAGVEDGDSSDLPDSDEEKPKVAKAQNGTAGQGSNLASGSLRRSGSGRGTISSPTTATAPTRPNHSRRGSFMSILRRKKPDSSSRVRKSDAESPARRDTPLERSKSDLAALKDRPTTPKLQKRNTMSRENSGAWPLPIPRSPPKIIGGENGRPFSADGPVVPAAVVGGGERPDMGTRRFTATGLADVDLNLNEGAKEGKKKKKFGALRRMFKLYD